MRWTIHVGDILDVPADVLICSANVHLNLSGGVGGAFALRYGSAMQENLHAYLAERCLHFVRRGELVDMPPCGSRYRSVLHAVAVDAAYDTSPEVVSLLLIESLHRAAASGAQRIALTALGTGYGRLSLAAFANALKAAMNREFPPIEQVVLGIRSRHDADELLESAPSLEIA